MLVEKDKILWSLQVDHRLFVLDKLDVTVSTLSGDSQTHREALGLGGETCVVVNPAGVGFSHEFSAVLVKVLLLYIHSVVQSLYSWMHYGQRPRKRRGEKRRKTVCVCVCVCVTSSTKKGC